MDPIRQILGPGGRCLLTSNTGRLLICAESRLFQWRQCAQDALLGTLDDLLGRREHLIRVDPRRLIPTRGDDALAVGTEGPAINRSGVPLESGQRSPGGRLPDALDKDMGDVFGGSAGSVGKLVMGVDRNGKMSLDEGSSR